MARYGEEAGRLEVGGRSISSWWQEVARICEGAGVDGGRWLEECVSRRVGDGAGTYFWYDKWLGGVSFCVRFSRLF